MFAFAQEYLTFLFAVNLYYFNFNFLVPPI